MENLTAAQRKAHSIPKDMTLLMTPENFDRIAEFQEDIPEDVPAEVFVVTFCVARYKGKKRYIQRDFRKQRSVESFQRLVEMAGGEVKKVETVHG